MVATARKAATRWISNPTTFRFKITVNKIVVAGILMESVDMTTERPVMQAVVVDLGHNRQEEYGRKRKIFKLNQHLLGQYEPMNLK